MRFVTLAALAMLTACVSTRNLPSAGPNFTVLSWNITGDAYAAQPSEFQALQRHAAPDIVLLDQVNPIKATAAQLRSIGTSSPGVG